MNETNETKRVYISAPISGYDLDERRKTFADMEQRLIAKGYEVCNPMGKQWQAGLTTQEYMRKDIEMLLTCDAIFLMSGWNRSAGCKCELDVAVAIGIEVWFEDISQPIKL